LPNPEFNLMMYSASKYDVKALYKRLCHELVNHKSKIHVTVKWQSEGMLLYFPQKTRTHIVSEFRDISLHWDYDCHG